MSALIDTLLPRWDVHEVHGSDVAASPEATWAAVREVTVAEMPVTRLLMAIRSLGRSWASDRRFVEVDFVTRLAEAPGDVVVGLIGRPWQVRPERVRFGGAGDFVAFDRPGYVRVATDLRVLPAPGGSRLTTETRIQATDPGARRRFGRYWRVIGWGSALIRRELLLAARRRAEAA